MADAEVQQFIQKQKPRLIKKSGDRMILITGCGFLGSYIAEYAAAKTNEPILATVRDLKNVKPIDGVEYIRCDITDENDLISLKNKCGNEPLTVFYLSACHNIDFVYENPDYALSVNYDALLNFLNTLPHIRKLFFASTDCVYGDGKEKFSEDSPLNPVNEYGRQKILAENLVRERGFTVFRYPFMLGKSLTSKPHFYDNIRKNLENGITTEMIDGMYRSVLSYRQAAKFTFELSLTENLPPTVNICSDWVLSKYDVGVILAENSGKASDLIKKISEAEGEKFFKDKRASCTAMDNILLKSLLNLKEIKWEEEKC